MIEYRAYNCIQKRERKSILFTKPDVFLPHMCLQAGCHLWDPLVAVRSIESLFLHCQCPLKLDRNATVQCIDPSMGLITALLINRLIDNITSWCG